MRPIVTDFVDANPAMDDRIATSQRNAEMGLCRGQSRVGAPPDPAMSTAPSSFMTNRKPAPARSEPFRALPEVHPTANSHLG